MFKIPKILFDSKHKGENKLKRNLIAITDLYLDVSIVVLMRNIFITLKSLYFYHIMLYGLIIDQIKILYRKYLRQSTFFF